MTKQSCPPHTPPSDVVPADRTVDGRRRRRRQPAPGCSWRGGVGLWQMAVLMVVVTGAASDPRVGSTSSTTRWSSADGPVPHHDDGRRCRRRWAVADDLAAVELVSATTSNKNAKKNKDGRRPPRRPQTNKQDGGDDAKVDGGRETSTTTTTRWKFWKSRDGRPSKEEDEEEVEENPPTQQKRGPAAPGKDEPTSESPETRSPWPRIRKARTQADVGGQKRSSGGDSSSSTGGTPTPEGNDEEGASKEEEASSSKSHKGEVDKSKPVEDVDDVTSKQTRGESGNEKGDKDEVTGDEKDPPKASVPEAPLRGPPVVYRAVPVQSLYAPQPRSQQQPSSAFSNLPAAQSQAMVLAVANLISLATKWILIRWLIKRMDLESEAKSPVQHYMWECLNDKFVVDTQVWDRVLRRKPSSSGHLLGGGLGDDGGNGASSRRRWNRIVHDMTVVAGATATAAPTDVDGGDRPPPEEGADRQPTEKKLKVPGGERGRSEDAVRTVLVLDVGNLDTEKLTNMVSFLVSTHARDARRHAASASAGGEGRPRRGAHREARSAPSSSHFHFGPAPEVVVLLNSPGGEVTYYGLCAAQIGRLRSAGFVVTACVDRVAASGGYMIASQASQILAAPFAVVGSIGVMAEGLNFHQLLKRYGIQPLTFKSGDQKNVISTLGEVTPRDIESRQADADVTHRAFVDMCLESRPQLDPAVCDGRVLFGQRALDCGMIDRILTSDEYLTEQMATGGALVMKLHHVSAMNERNMLVRALEILPHLRHRTQAAWAAVFGGGSVGGISDRSRTTFGADARIPGFQWPPGVDADLVSNVVQGVALLSMIRRALTRYQKQQQQQQQQNGLWNGF